ncbi:MAG: hypothetical protein H6633_24970 [Anaerolineales bacterium]|nr:hypothetical protein [Anaerolineales bacterium]
MYSKLPPILHGFKVFLGNRNIRSGLGVSFLVFLFTSLLFVSAKVQSVFSRTDELISGNKLPHLISRNALDEQIIVNPDNPAWLKYNNGGPFFMCGPGDPEDFLYRGTQNADGTRRGDQMALIQKLAGTGANSIYFQAIRSNGGDGDATHNPFINNDPSKGLNEKILDQWETWFSKMDENGIVIYFFFYDDDASIWNTGNQVGNAERNFIQTIVNRFEHHKNLIWVVAEEYQEKFSSTRVSNIAAEIRNIDDHNHVIAVHKLNGLGFSEFANNPNIDQFAIQYNVNSALALHNGMVTAWRDANGRYNLNMSEAANHGTGGVARKKNWATAMGGAYVMQLGMNIADTSINDLNDCGRLVNFMESTNFYEMSPHDEVALDGTEYVLANQGESYIAYASNLSGKIGLRNMEAGTYDFKWYDATNGRTVIQENVNVAAGNRTWSKPSTIGNELAVYINRHDDEVVVTPSTASPTAQSTSSPTSDPTKTVTPTDQPTDEPTQPSTTITPSPSSTAETTPELNFKELLIDTFDRANSSLVGNGWTEVEDSGAEVGISSNHLHFIDTSDRENRPIVQHKFDKVPSGKLTWEFEFDWERGNGEGSYQLLMQLGDSDLMRDSSQNIGAGINLIWTQIDGNHEMLGYRQNGTDNSLTKLSGLSRISVTADLDNFTYMVAVNDQLIEDEIPFDEKVSLDTVRFLTHELNEENVFKRGFDNIEIKSLSEQSTPMPAPTLTPTPSPTDIPVTSTPTNEPSPADTTTPEPDSSMPVLIFDGPSSVSPDESFAGSIVLKNVTGNGLYGIQLELIYDPNLLSIENLQVNPNLTFVLKSNADNLSGVMTLVASQKGAISGITGNVTMLNFDVTAANTTGIVDLDFENVKVSNPQAIGIEVATQPHKIMIGENNTPEPTDEPTDDPTPVPTSTPTDEPPSPTPSVEPTTTPTGVPNTLTISGQIILPGEMTTIGLV